MRGIILASAAMLALSGCATVQSAGNKLCEHYEAVKNGLELARIQAITIPNEQARSAVIVAIDASLFALTRCPQATGPLPVGPLPPLAGQGGALGTT